MKTKRDSDLIQVCDNCFRASCWQGQFHCEGFKTASTEYKTRRELRRLKLESPHYWLTDAEISKP